MVADLPATDRAHGLVRCPSQKPNVVVGHPSLHKFCIDFVECRSMEANERLLYIILPIKLKSNNAFSFWVTDTIEPALSSLHQDPRKSFGLSCTHVLLPGCFRGVGRAQVNSNAMIALLTSPPAFSTIECNVFDERRTLANVVTRLIAGVSSVGAIGLNLLRTCRPP